MGRYLILIISLVFCSLMSVEAQYKTVEDNGNGKPIVLFFGDFHSGFGKNNDDRGFVLERAYLGYEHWFDSGLSVKGVVDMGAAAQDNKRVAYIKFAQVSWQKGDWAINGGLISSTQMDLIYKHWDHRYVDDIFQGNYKFGSSADLGLSVAWTPSKWLSLDAMVVNGEGYKKLQYEDGLLYAFGATIMPLKGWTIRNYVGLNEQNTGSNTMNYSVFSSYIHNGFTIGAEYNYLTNNNGVKDYNKSGYSFFGTVDTNEWSELYVRYDRLILPKDDVMGDEESMLLVGVQFKLGQYVKLSPNFRIIMPKDYDKLYSAFLSCYFSL